MRLALFTAIATFATALGAAAGSHDGRWQVAAATSTGPCGSYLLQVVLSGDQVRLANAGGEAAGSVDAHGNLDLRLSRGQELVRATGRLFGERGRGRWVTGSGQCSGTWQAERTG
jgi:hypothetical protein